MPFFTNRMNNQKEFDLVAIGDTAVDCFIKLRDAHLTCEINKETCQICMHFGDKIPYEEVYILPGVGNSPNASIGASRLGLKTALITNLGKDQSGQNSLDVFTKNGVNTDFIDVQVDKKTNYHYVLWYINDRTILIKHEEYTYTLPSFSTPSWIYLSSLSENSLDYHYEIIRYLNEHPEIKLSFQPGTFQIKFGSEELIELYKRSELFFCNKEEAQGILKTKEEDPKILLLKMHELGPKIIVITDAEKGAYLYTDNECWSIPSFPDQNPPLERTGAGDATASTFTTAIALGKTTLEALTWSMINARSVINHVGAQTGLLTREEIERKATTAPEDYRPTKL